MKDSLKITFLLSLIALSWDSSLAQQSGNFAGRVIFETGDVIAEDESSNSRELTRRAAIYAGDTILVSSHGSVQFRMIDSALIALSCDSELKVEDYWYEESTQDTVTLRLLKGKFRTVTGNVAELDRSRYQLLINDIRITVNGTDFEVIVDFDGTVYFANYDGSITIENPHGTLRLGIGADGDFARVLPDQAPELLFQQPTQLGQLPLVQENQPSANTGCNY